MNATQLKVIGIVSMTIDHIGYFLFPQMTVLRVIGRLAYPIFAYMIAEGWKRVLKNNQSYLSDPEKQKVLRFAMQRPALYLNELEACMEQILAETLEEAKKTA